MMRLSQWTLALSLTAAGLFGATTLIAQDGKGTPDAGAEMMQMPPEFSPGPNHKMLEPFVGEWKAVVKFWMEPGAEPSQSEGSASARMIMDGRWLQEDFTGDFAGMPFKGMGMTGYDPFKKKYVSTWIDSMSTTMMTQEGAVDSDGKVFTYTGKSFDPFMNMETTTKTVLTVDSHDQHTMKMYMITPDGAEMQTMEIVYTRK